MRRLFIVTTLAILLSTTGTGCRVAEWFRRGDQCDQCPPTCGGGGGLIGGATTLPYYPGNSGPETLPQPLQ